MALLLTVYQVTPALGNPPLHLYLIFTGVWLFGALMLWRFPLVGAAGTAAYGLLLGFRLLGTHEVRAQNVVLAGASVFVALLAAVHLARLLGARRRRG